ncbi:galactose oxidase [Rhizoclosmatium globosum]|uniref:Galactose oxidase n=1 Tax=Rhizoclosmatium globosum TaxID=329046 RepID=A0A1Y2CIK2_9FUNG|nr:galactose oxidase [Rhizoclosmatium globosum]|eukprot:ORY46878.1 galactose oxidase [Rhizoclosmatium globosum]
MPPRCARGAEVPIGRSSHSVNVVNSKVLIFSGEELPRVPIAANPANNFGGSGFEAFDLGQSVWVKDASAATKTGAPQPRVGHASAQIGNKIYILGGRGGAEMVPFDSDLFEFDADTGRWNIVSPASKCTVESRSYHSMTASKDYVFVFGGCPAKGRLNDLHQFDPATRTWTQFPSHSEISPRGGPALAVLGDRLVVFGGFNGNELGDMWTIPVGKDAGPIAEREWKRIMVPVGSLVPDRRSVAGFVALTDKFVLFHGERDPSSKGHEGAGLYHRDVWTFKFTSKENDAVQTGIWEEQEVEQNGQNPTARGWIAAAPLNGDKVVMVGGFDGEVRDNGVYLLSFD